jgi:hypothetical protein
MKVIVRDRRTRTSTAYMHGSREIVRTPHTELSPEYSQALSVSADSRVWADPGRWKARLNGSYTGFRLWLCIR